MEETNCTNDLRQPVRMALGAGNLGLGIFLALVAIATLRARYLPVDLGVGLVATLLAASGAALLLRVGPAAVLARVASGVTLAVGLSIITGLIVSASYLRGIYGDLGRGASSMFLLVAFAVVPYLVVYPVVALALLRGRGGESGDGGAGGPARGVGK